MQLPAQGTIFERRYRLERELGAGGFACVYLARDEHVGRPVAVKILKPDAPTGYAPDTTARFLREVEALALLRHPNTVTLYERGTSAEGLHFMVFERLEGRDLSELLAQHGRLDSSTVGEILRQLLGALQEAHDAGVVHRDIKPQNIRMVSAPGEPPRVKLFDFGIARSTDDGHPSVTKTGQLVGTPRYMSPEQLTERALTPRSDLYSLGVVCFELLLGEAALSGHSWGAQLERLRTGHFFSVPELQRIDPHLARVLERLTAREPRDRFVTARDALRALTEPLAGPVAPSPSAVSTTQPGPAVAPVAIRPRDRSVLVVVAPMVACLLALVVVVVVLVQEPPPTAPVAEPPPPMRPLPAFGGTEPAPQPEPMPTPVTPPLPEHGTVGCGVESPHHSPEVEVFLPPDYDPHTAHPALIWLPEDLDSAERVPQTPVFEALRAEHRVIVVAPSSQRVWRPEHAEGIRADLDLVASEYCLDPWRTYVASSGAAGTLAERLACEPWIAAVAIASHLYEPDDRVSCDAPRPAMWIFPTGSAHHPFAGGPDCRSVPKLGARETIRLVRERYRCRRGQTLTHQEATGECHAQACEVDLEVCEVSGGQGWPGTPPTVISAAATVLGCREPPPARFTATEQAWRFFADKRAPMRFDAEHSQKVEDSAAEN